MTNQAEELITQLEAEIVKRDARIAELEATKPHGEMVMLRTERDRLAAELKYTIAAYVTGNKTSAGVVLPEREDGHNRMYHPHYSKGWNECLDEVARLNAGRAVQAGHSEQSLKMVSDIPECYQRMLTHAFGMTFGEDWNRGTAAEQHRNKLIEAVFDCRHLHAAPSAQQKESGDE